MVLGGSRQGLWSDAVLQFAGLILICATLFRDTRWPDYPAIAIVAAILLLPLVQLINLPPGVWSALPGRAGIAESFKQADLATPWLPISLDPSATVRAWFTLIPATAIFLATMQLDFAARRALSLVIIAFGLISVLLGLAQLMQGHNSALRLYPFTNIEDSVGFFANRNHYAALLVALIPATVAWLVSAMQTRSEYRPLSIAIGAIAYVSLLLGLGMARSRAGIALAVVATLLSLSLATRRRSPTGRSTFFAVGVASIVGCLFVAYYAFFRLLGRFDADLLGDIRLTIAEVTTGAAWIYQPFGSGFGTFESIYRMFEPREALQETYINHAHNDWLELFLEGGIPAALLLAAFLIWFAVRSMKLWRAPSLGEYVIDTLLARSATIAILLLLLFSLVDYPLRTTSLSVLIAWSAALLTGAVFATDFEEPDANRGHRRTARHQRTPEQRERRPARSRQRSARSRIS